MKNALQDITKQVFANLLKVSVFYIPEEFVSLLDLSHDVDVLKEINQLLKLDTKGNIIRVEQEKLGLFMMPKKTYLNENIFLLYDCKEKFSKGGFDYVIDKYEEMLWGLFYTSEWFLNHVEKSILELTKDQKTAFILQHNFYLEHKQEFETKFKKQPKIFEFNAQTAKTVFNNIKPFSPKLSKQQFVQSKTNKKLNKKQFIEKLKNDTEAKAEDYLLKTVFKVDVN